MLLSIELRLPSAGHQIKLQRDLNQCFCSLLLLVLESNLACCLVFNRYHSEESAHNVDIITDFIGFLNGFCAVYLH